MAQHPATPEQKHRQLVTSTTLQENQLENKDVTYQWVKLSSLQEMTLIEHVCVTKSEWLAPAGYKAEAGCREELLARIQSCGKARNCPLASCTNLTEQSLADRCAQKLLGEVLPPATKERSQ